MEYRAEIDGLRALAVIPVIFFHAGFSWFSGGFVGVDVFFVISGYLITTLIINELNKDKFTLLDFYERRARRILPALFFVMLVCLPVAWAWLTPNEFSDFGKSILATVGFASNFFFWFESGYFDTSSELKPLLHTWSLAVEEQYYLLFPVFMITFWQLGRKSMVQILAVLFLLSLGLAHWASTQQDDPELRSAAFFLLPTRIWELLLGVFAAFYLEKSGYSRSPVINQCASLIGLALITSSVVLLQEETPFPSVYALPATVGTVMLIVFSTSPTLAQRLLSHPLLVTIGLLSYSAYLWHQPLLAFARFRSIEELSVPTLLLLCTLTFGLAFISWKWVETPFRKPHVISKNRLIKLSVTTASLFLITGISFATLLEPRLSRSEEVSGGDIGHEEFYAYLEANFPSCQNSELVEQAETWEHITRCKQTNQFSQPQIALLGDSHAEHLFLGLADKLSENLIYLVKPGTPFIGEENFNHLFEFIQQNPSIDTIILAGYWSIRLRSIGHNTFETRLAQTLQFFQDNDKKVVIVEDTPDFTFDPQQCIYRSEQVNASRCRISRSTYTAQREVARRIFSQHAENREIEVIDIGDLFCNEQHCSMSQDGTLLFRDNDHLNIPASIMAGAAILERSEILGRRE